MSETGSERTEISIVIIDGQDVVHAGIAAWLTGSRPPIKIVDNFSHPADFISVYPAATPVVDIVLCALQYEGGRPEFDSLRQMCRAGHKVIVYSYLVADEVILTSLDAGAVSYVAKSEGGKHLCDAIYSARADKPYAPPRMARALSNNSTAGRPRLSQREREVLVAWFQTESKDLVAKRLFVEPSTVRTHLTRIRAKYAAVGRPAPTKAALIARAVQDGILTPDDL